MTHLLACFTVTGQLATFASSTIGWSLVTTGTALEPSARARELASLHPRGARLERQTTQRPRTQKRSTPTWTFTSRRRVGLEADDGEPPPSAQRSMPWPTRHAVSTLCKPETAATNAAVLETPSSQTVAGSSLQSNCHRCCQAVCHSPECPTSDRRHEQACLNRRAAERGARSQPSRSKPATTKSTVAAIDCVLSAMKVRRRHPAERCRSDGGQCVLV